MKQLELPIGRHDGIRVYYLPGDSPWRYQHDCIRHALAGHGWALSAKAIPLWNPETDYGVWCELCGFVGQIDHFDVIGADAGKLFCPECGGECDGEEFPLEMEAT